MRIIHFADAHIGVETHSRPVSSAELDTLPKSFAPGVDRRAVYAGMPSGLIDALRALDELVEHALSDPRADLVIFAGDAYRSRDPSQTHQREFARRINRMAGAGIPVFLLAGNHDVPNTEGRATTLDIFDALAVRNVTVGARLGIHNIETRAGAVQIMAAPWLRRSAVVARTDHHGKSVDEVNEWMQEFLTSEIQRMASELDPEIPAVLAAHATVSTATLGHERSLMMGRDYVLLPSALQAHPIDYAALGHVHRHQRIAHAPPVVYAGSLHRVDFSEENDDKGFCVVEIDPGLPAGSRVTEWTRRSVWARPFKTLTISLREADSDPMRSIEERLSRFDVTDATVRVEVGTPAALAGAVDRIRIQSLLRQAGAHVVAGVTVRADAVERSRVRLGHDTAIESLTPERALMLYLDKASVAPERQRALLADAREIIVSELGMEAADMRSIDEVSVRVAAPQDMESAFALRREVFIDEQQVDPDEEWDGRDDAAIHVVALIDDEIVGTGRLILGRDEGMDETKGRIGRMAVRQALRRKGIGMRILARLEEEALARGVSQALLHAQTYVTEFYRHAGYLEHGERFYEAGIEHIAMTKDLTQTADARAVSEPPAGGSVNE